MKLLLLTTDINIVGGIETVINSLTNYFAEEYEYDIEIMSLYGEKNDKDNTHFHFNNKLKITFANLNNIQGKNRLDGLIKDLKLKTYIKNIIQNKDVDIIMTFHYPISIATILNKKNINCKIVVTEHNDYYHGIGRVDLLKRKIVYKGADKVIVLTENNKQIYKSFLKNVEVINNPRTFKTNMISTQSQKRMIAAGRLEFEKGFDQLIEIFNDEFIKKSNWKLDIYGDGTQKGNLEKKIVQHSLQDKIRLLPFTKNIKEEFLSSSIFLLPSRTEAFSMVLLEAMECGLACISFDLSGPSEIIHNGQDGFIVEKNNINEFREKLKILIDSQQIRALYGKNAKKNVKRFDIKNISNKWKTLFEEILK